MALAPKGNYWGYIKNAVTTTAKTGTTMMVVTFDVTSRLGPGGEWENLDSEMQRSINLALTPAALEWTHKKLKAMGFNGDFGSPEFSNDGLEFECTHEDDPKDSGKTYERWDLANWGGGRTYEPVESDVVRKLNAQFKQFESSESKPTANRPGPPPGSVMGAPDLDEPPPPDESMAPPPRRGR